ncbi:hypothetical protein FRB93_009670 [Tulasnella sp. JGI-2019a]|nr:hypothetical protein FRB93_009670 [Tulasnella sp. JGI-2019a]
MEKETIVGSSFGAAMQPTPPHQVNSSTSQSPQIPPTPPSLPVLLPQQPTLKIKKSGILRYFGKSESSSSMSSNASTTTNSSVGSTPATSPNHNTLTFKESTGSSSKDSKAEQEGFTVGRRSRRPSTAVHPLEHDAPSRSLYASNSDQRIHSNAGAQRGPRSTGYGSDIPSPPPQRSFHHSRTRSSPFNKTKHNCDGGGTPSAAPAEPSSGVSQQPRGSSPLRTLQMPRASPSPAPGQYQGPLKIMPVSAQLATTTDDEQNLRTVVASQSRQQQEALYGHSWPHQGDQDTFEEVLRDWGGYTQASAEGMLQAGSIEAGSQGVMLDQTSGRCEPYSGTTRALTGSVGRRAAEEMIREGIVGGSAIGAQKAVQDQIPQRHELHSEMKRVQAESIGSRAVSPQPMQGREVDRRLTPNTETGKEHPERNDHSSPEATRDKGTDRHASPHPVVWDRGEESRLTPEPLQMMRKRSQEMRGPSPSQFVSKGIGRHGSPRPIEEPLELSAQSSPGLLPRRVSPGPLRDEPTPSRESTLLPAPPALAPPRKPATDEPTRYAPRPTPVASRNPLDIYSSLFNTTLRDNSEAAMLKPPRRRAGAARPSTSGGSGGSSGTGFVRTRLGDADRLDLVGNGDGMGLDQPVSLRKRDLASAPAAAQTFGDIRNRGPDQQQQTLHIPRSRSRRPGTAPAVNPSAPVARTTSATRLLLGSIDNGTKKDGRVPKRSPSPLVLQDASDVPATSVEAGGGAARIRPFGAGEAWDAYSANQIPAFRGKSDIGRGKELKEEQSRPNSRTGRGEVDRPLLAALPSGGPSFNPSIPARRHVKPSRSLTDIKNEGDSQARANAIWGGAAPNSTITAGMAGLGTRRFVADLGLSLKVN